MPQSIWTSDGDAWQLSFPGESAERAVRTFVSDVERKCADDHPDLRAMCDWAYRLGYAGLATLETTQSDVWTALRLIPQGETKSFVTVNHDATNPHTFLRLWGSVLKRSAPNSMMKIEEIGGPVGAGPSFDIPAQGCPRGGARRISRGIHQASGPAYPESHPERRRSRRDSAASLSQRPFSGQDGAAYVLFRGETLNVRYDPRTGSTPRSARLFVGKERLVYIEPNSVLTVSRDLNGQLRLD